MPGSSCEPCLRSPPIGFIQPKDYGHSQYHPGLFSDGGALYEQGNLNSSIAKKAEQMLAEGAALIDVGGESTRPGAAPVSLQGGARPGCRHS